MKFDTKKFPLAAAVTMAIIYIICTVFVAIFPEVATKIFGWMIHMTLGDEGVRGQNISLGGFFVSLVQLVFYTYLSAWIFSTLYNKFTSNK
ncbi:MAG: hypothetical protein A2126_00825 [Candidatus Woykebacteria bacterium GWB1_45_5]|uniref:Uncharacterized protein n=1 Tax=Candidatus Woykebacteria bacterium GWB1_45_5 TaxID=1802592 RepID=A0A1G1WBX6_9BACT|nr:MAG: hypothetical protein A2126_00825 [Candidatus Woykebacteria bacterium GWB1_45_5]